MELYLMRHGIAVERGTRGFEDDFARPLTPKGRRQLRKTAAAPPAMMACTCSGGALKVGGISLASTTPSRPLVPAPT